MSDDKKGGAAVVIGIVLVLGLIGSLFKKDSSDNSSSTPLYESTEEKLRRVYNSQGIQHDPQMLREDARAIENLHREFGK